jgi:hypothetical protein
MLVVLADQGFPAGGAEFGKAAADVVVGDETALGIEGAGDASEQAAEGDLEGARQRGDEESEAVEGEAQPKGESRVHGLLASRRVRWGGRGGAGEGGGAQENLRTRFYKSDLSV